MISNPDKCIVTFPNGNIAFGHMLEAAKVYAFEEGQREEIEAQPTATHVLTFRQKAVDAAGGVKEGDVVHYEDCNKEDGVDLTGNWEVLREFDPYAGKGVKRIGTVVVEQSDNSQERTWLKCLVRRV